MRRRGALLAGTILVALAPAPPAAGQDLEVVSRLRGVPLPPAYYRTIGERPDAFRLPNGLFGRARGDVRPRRVEGTARLPVLLALFADSRDPHISPAEVRASLFDGPAPRGTLTDFYEEVSGGRFRLEGDVRPWVRTSLTIDEAVGDSYGLGGTARLGEYLVEALTLNDPAVDFGRFDDDGPDGVPNSGDDDGVVDAMTFEFLEVAASCGGPAVWPHRSGISRWRDGDPYATDDLRPDGSPVLVDGYIIQSVADCSGERVQGSATIAHEFGHVLGLPDYYHPIDGITPENRRWVLGCWALMAAGSWGCGPVTERVAFGPSHFIARSKEVLGWVEYDEVGEVRDQEVVLEPVSTSGRALLIPLDEAGNESLLLEYRIRAGFDADLPAEGVLVTHRDLAAPLRPESGRRYFLSMLEADANGALLRVAAEGGNRGEAGDVWGAPGSPGRLNAFTVPSLRLNATGRSTPVAVHSMTVAGGQARIRLSTAPTPEVRPSSEPIRGRVARTLGDRLRVAGGYMPYTASVASGELPAGVEPGGDEDALVFLGSPREAGTFDAVLRLLDARGNATEVGVTISVQEFLVSEARLLQPLLDNEEEPLTVDERLHLDRIGNANGRFDVGDVRAWLLGNG